LKTIYKNAAAVPSFKAGDDTQIREVLHPKNDGQDFGFSLALASLEAGEASKPHILHGRSETYILRSGQGRAYIGGQAIDLQAGEVVFIPPGEEQYIENTGQATLTFWCVVCPPWSAETEEVGDKRR
jgi:mannose-6-phosphate isomerase-like protein (cupin superfamily)